MEHEREDGVAVIGYGLAVQKRAEGIITLSVKRREKEYQKTQSTCTERPFHIRIFNLSEFVFKPKRGPEKI